MTRQALTGVRILDFSWIVAGPMATKWMAANGAQVIKVESIQERLDDLRQDPGPQREGQPLRGVSGMQINANPGKLSIGLNMNKPSAQAIARRLAAISDVVLDNFSPPVMPKWSLSYEELRTINPQIIVARMPGLGLTGPHAHYRGLGSYFQARTGLDSLTGFPHRPTVDLGYAYPDGACNPDHIATAILAALHHRNRTGKGQFIELSQFESAVNFLETALFEYLVNGTERTRWGNRHPTAAPHGIYRCLPTPGHPGPDDSWCAITVFNDTEWGALCRALGHPEWQADPRFATLPARKKHEDELDAAITEWTSTKTPHEVMELLQTTGVIAGAFQDHSDLLGSDPQMAHRGFYVELEHAEMGRLHHESMPYRLSATPWRLDRPAPISGQETDWVLQEILGIPEEEVNQYVIERAVMA